MLGIDMKCKVCGLKFKTKKTLVKHHKSTACGKVDTSKPVVTNMFYRRLSGTGLEMFEGDLATHIQQYGIRNVLQAAINGLEKQKVLISRSICACKELMKTLPINSNERG